MLWLLILLLPDFELVIPQLRVEHNHYFIATGWRHQYIYRNEAGEIVDWTYVIPGLKVGPAKVKGFDIEIVEIYETWTDHDPEVTEQDGTRVKRCLWCNNNERRDE